MAPVAMTSCMAGCSSSFDAGLLDGFGVATPALIEARALATRVDTKFVMPSAVAARILAGLADEYALVAAGAARIARYRTNYFDTPELELFHAHRRGLPRRQKIRIRSYLDRDLTMLEVKTRTAGDRTTKERLVIPAAASIGPEERAFLSRHSNVGDAVVPSTRIDFRRISLAGVSATERVTCDLDLELYLGRQRAALPDLAILEVKQSVLDRATPVMEALRAAGLRPGWASKYCLSIALLRPGIRCPAFAAGLRTIRSITTRSVA